jgi:hypothetical protein
VPAAKKLYAVSRVAETPGCGQGPQRETDGLRRVGVLMGYAEADPEAQIRATTLLQALAALEWIEGRNVQILFRYAPAGTDLSRRCAKELVELRLLEPAGSAGWRSRVVTPEWRQRSRERRGDR